MKTYAIPTVDIKHYKVGRFCPYPINEFVTANKSAFSIRMGEDIFNYCLAAPQRCAFLGGKGVWYLIEMTDEEYEEVKDNPNILLSKYPQILEQL